jgi:hypothetical protein
LTGYEPALDVAEKLAGQLKTYFSPDGYFTGHFHAKTFVLLALTDYALLTDDHELLEFVSKYYECARTQGWPIVGYSPEFIPQRPSTCESCEVTEMAALSVKLSEAGIGDFWDDADRCIRNQLTENQLRDVDWIEKMVQPDPQRSLGVDPDYDGTRDVANRLLGCWSAHGGANDWWVNYPRAPGFTACCLGNGARGLYYAWENILSLDKDELRVHLLTVHPGGRMSTATYLMKAAWISG